MYKEIFYDRQFRVWVGKVTNLKGDQIGDCEYFPNKIQALEWKAKLIETVTDGGSMWNGFGKVYF